MIWLTSFSTLFFSFLLLSSPLYFSFLLFSTPLISCCLLFSTLFYSPLVSPSLLFSCRYLMRPGPDVVIADEAHTIKDPKAKINISISRIGNLLCHTIYSKVVNLLYHTIHLKVVTILCSMENIFHIFISISIFNLLANIHLLFIRAICMKQMQYNIISSSASMPKEQFNNVFNYHDNTIKLGRF